MEVGAQQQESGRRGSAGPWERMSGSPYPWEESPSVLQGAECHTNFIHKGITVIFIEKPYLIPFHCPHGNMALKKKKKAPTGLLCENTA